MRDLLDVYSEALEKQAGLKPVPQSVATPPAPKVTPKLIPSTLTNEPALQQVIEIPKRIRRYFEMPQLTPRMRAIRNAIEESIRKEKELRAEAQRMLSIANKRWLASDNSLLGWLRDIGASAIPGTKLASFTKTARRRPKPLTDPAHTWFDTALNYGQLGSMGLGVHMGLSGTAFRPETAENVARAAIARSGKKLPAVMKELGEEFINLPTQGAPNTALKEIANAGTLKQYLKNLPGRILGRPSTGQQLRSRLASTLGRWTLGSRGRAIGLGLALSLPFTILKLIRNRQSRAAGGSAARLAALRSRRAMEGIWQLQDWRKRQFAEIERAYREAGLTPPTQTK